MLQIQKDEKYLQGYILVLYEPQVQCLNDDHELRWYSTSHHSAYTSLGSAQRSIELYAQQNPLVLMGKRKIVSARILKYTKTVSDKQILKLDEEALWKKN